MRSAGIFGVLALAACPREMNDIRPHLTLDANMDQRVIIGHAMAVEFGWLAYCDQPGPWDRAGRDPTQPRSRPSTCGVGEASLYLECSIACEAKGPTITTNIEVGTEKLLVWPKQLGDLIITATVTRVATGESKTSHLAVQVVQPRFLLCPVGRKPANQLPGPGVGCTDEPSVTVDPAQPRARIRLAIMDKDHPRRVYSFQLSRELRANGRPLPPPHMIDLRTLFPERMRGAAMAPGDYPIALELGPQRATVTFVVEPPR